MSAAEDMKVRVWIKTGRQPTHSASKPAACAMHVSERYWQSKDACQPYVMAIWHSYLTQAIKQESDFDEADREPMSGLAARTNTQRSYRRTAYVRTTTEVLVLVDRCAQDVLAHRPTRACSTLRTRTAGKLTYRTINAKATRRRSLTVNDGD